jgi:hypothetical protein
VTPRATEPAIDIDETVDVEVPPESVVEQAEMVSAPVQAAEAYADVEADQPEPMIVADAEVIRDTDEDDEPQPDVTPDGRPVGSRGAGAGGGGKSKRSSGGSRGGGGRKTSGTPRQPRAAAVEAQRHAKTAKPRPRKRAS